MSSISTKTYTQERNGPLRDWLAAWISTTNKILLSKQMERLNTNKCLLEPRMVPKFMTPSTWRRIMSKTFIKKCQWIWLKTILANPQTVGHRFLESEYDERRKKTRFLKTKGLSTIRLLSLIQTVLVDTIFPCYCGENLETPVGQEGVFRMEKLDVWHKNKCLFMDPFFNHLSSQSGCDHLDHWTSPKDHTQLV